MDQPQSSLPSCVSRVILVAAAGEHDPSQLEEEEPQGIDHVGVAAPDALAAHGEPEQEGPNQEQDHGGARAPGGGDEVEFR